MASPFRYFRKHTKAFLAVAAVLAIFIFVVGDAISRGSYGGGGDGGTQTVATWNGGKLNVAQLSSLMAQRRLTDEFLKSVFVQGGGSEYDPPRVPALFLNSQQLDQLETVAIELEVMSDLAEQAGMSVSDNVINHYIEEIGLRKVSGEVVGQILANIGRANQQANEAIVFNTLRKMLLQHFYRRSFGDASLVVLPEQRWEDWRKVNERISVEAAVLPVEKFIAEVPEPNENQLLAFYNEYKDVEPGRFRNESGRELPMAEPGFAEPRRIRLQYLLGSVAGRAEQLMDKITEEEINEYYEDNKRTEFTKMGLPGEDAFNPPADDAAETPTTEGGTAAEQSPPADDGAETPPANEAQPPVETPAAEPEAPAASGAEATEAPAESQTPATEPAAPAETESNESSSRTERRSPFRLVAFQETSADGGDEASAEAQPSSAEAADADAESAESSAAPDADGPPGTSTEATSAPAETAAPAEQGSTDDSSAPAAPAAPATGGAVIDPAASLPADEDVEFEPLENVRDEIRRKLAEVKAEEELQRIMAEAAAQLQAEYNRYGTQVAGAKEKGQTAPEPPAKLADLKWLADKYGLTYEKTAPLTVRELFDTAVGKAVDAASERVTVTEAAYRSLQLFEPMLATEIVGDWYLVMKTEDAPRRIPPFKEVRDQVVQAWKRAEAAKLAEKKAEELAAEVSKTGAPFDQFFFAERGYEVIKPTAFFSWRSYPVGQAGAGVPPSLSEVPELKSVGEDFMKAAFSLEGNEAVGLLNADHSVAYVIRLDRKQYPDDELKQLFLKEERGWLGQRDMLVEHYSVANEAINKEIEERAGLEFNQEWLEERARQLQQRLN